MAANIFLIGFMGTGKTTVSKQLGSLLGLQEIDLDMEIERREQRKISEIFNSQGEKYFRTLETRLIREFEKKPGYVISCGGGAVLRLENVESMKKNGMVVLLTAEPETVYERVRFGRNRPLLNGHMDAAYIAELMAKREPFYRAAADVAVATDKKQPKVIAEEIMNIMKENVKIM